MRDQEMPRESGQRAATCWSDILSRAKLLQLGFNNQ